MANIGEKRLRWGKMDKDHIPLSSLVDQYLITCRTEGKTPATLRSYRGKLGWLIRWCNEACLDKFVLAGGDLAPGMVGLDLFRHRAWIARSTGLTGVAGRWHDDVVRFGPSSRPRDQPKRNILARISANVSTGPKDIDGTRRSSMTTPAATSDGHASVSTQTRILPPMVALRITWTLTGKGSKSPESRNRAHNEEDRLKDFKKRAEDSGDSKEIAYLEGVISIVNSGLRDLGIILEGRNKNFEEVDELWSAQFESIEHYSKLTANWQSAFSRLSAGGIGGLAGAMGLYGLLEATGFEVTDAWRAGFTLGGIFLFYILNEVVVVPVVKRAKMRDIMRRDYDRNLYYDQYVERSRLALRSIYRDLERLHSSTFGKPYDGSVSEDEVVRDIMAGVPSTMCQHIHNHMLRAMIPS